MKIMRISFLPACVVADYSDGNGNVSGGESEDEIEAGKEEKTNASKDDEISSHTHHEHHNEIEEQTSTTTQTSTTPAQNLTLPCDSDRGGCDHECKMVKYYYDPEPIIQCSCYSGFTLDENDGRRCHGEKYSL